MIFLLLCDAQAVDLMGPAAELQLLTDTPVGVSDVSWRLVLRPRWLAAVDLHAALAAGRRDQQLHGRVSARTSVREGSLAAAVCP